MAKTQPRKSPRPSPSSSTQRPSSSTAAGTYATAKTITITDATSGATIYYTLNGSIPTTASTKYTAVFKIAATTTVKALALAPGHSNSPVATSTYTIN